MKFYRSEKFGGDEDQKDLEAINEALEQHENNESFEVVGVTF